MFCTFSMTERPIKNNDLQKQVQKQLEDYLKSENVFKLGPV